jgi:hypothetical protein
MNKNGFPEKFGGPVQILITPGPIFSRKMLTSGGREVKIFSGQTAVKT